MLIKVEDKDCNILDDIFVIKDDHSHYPMTESCIDYIEGSDSSLIRKKKHTFYNLIRKYFGFKGIKFFNYLIYDFKLIYEKVDKLTIYKYGDEYIIAFKSIIDSHEGVIIQKFNFNKKELELLKDYILDIESCNLNGIVYFEIGDDYAYAINKWDLKLFSHPYLNRIISTNHTNLSEIKNMLLLKNSLIE